jgi:hypothetical protein
MVAFLAFDVLDVLLSSLAAYSTASLIASIYDSIVLGSEAKT